MKTVLKMVYVALCLGGVLLSFVTAVRFEASVIDFQAACMYLIISGLSILAGIEMMKRLELEDIINAKHVIIQRREKTSWEKLSPEWKSYFLGFDDV